jgi:hypothetical protein
METQLDKGVLVPSAVINMPAAATGVLIFQLSNFAQQIGTKSFGVKKLFVRNNAGGTNWLSLGTGLAGAFVASMPSFRTINNFENTWSEIEIPDVEFFADLTASVDALVAAGSLDVQVEVEEIG